MHGYELDFAVMGRPPADVSVDVRQLGRNPHIIVARKGIGWGRIQASA